eukprot:11170075-Lingulodinium_polyedra.AAC.1
MHGPVMRNACRYCQEIQLPMAMPSPVGGPTDVNHLGAPNNQRNAQSLTRARHMRVARAYEVHVAITGDNERGAGGHVVL